MVIDGNTTTNIIASTKYKYKAILYKQVVCILILGVRNVFTFTVLVLLLL